MCQKTARYGNPQRLVLPITCVAREGGFSLVDLLFTLLLASILLSLAVPAYTHLVVETRLLALTERISNAINMARSEAIKRQGVTLICKSKDGRTCGGHWRDGWIVLFDKKAGSSFEDSLRLLRVYPPLAKSECVDWHGAGMRDYLQLKPDGSAPGQNGSFVVRVSVLSTQATWLVRVSSTGRVRVDKEAGNRIDCNN